MRLRIRRATAAVLIVLIVAIVAVLLTGPDDVRADVLAGLGALGGLLLAQLGPVLTQDKDGDGVPDVLEGDDDA